MSPARVLTRLPARPVFTPSLARALSFFRKVLFIAIHECESRGRAPSPLRGSFDVRPFLELFTILNTTHLNLLSWPFAAAPVGVFGEEGFEVCERQVLRALQLDNIPGSQRSLFKHHHHRH